MLQHPRDKEGVPEEQQMFDCCHWEEGEDALDVMKDDVRRYVSCLFLTKHNIHYLHFYIVSSTLFTYFFLF